MALRYNAGRQEKIVAVQKLFDTSGATTGLETGDKVCELPENAIVTGGFVRVVTANGAVATLDIGTTANDDKYTATAVDLNAAADTAITLPVDVIGAGGEEIFATVASGTIDNDTLEAYLIVEYVEVGRAAFSQG